jgi:type IV pilus assembly protein PilY1
LDIPSGAEVTRAQIEFTVKDVDDSTAVPLTIQGEKRDSGFFYTSNGLISERTRTDAAVAWTLSGDYSNGDKVLTTDVSDIVSEIISDASWNPSGGGEDDIVFIMDPGTGSSDGDYELYTYDGASGVGSRPTLYLEYYVGTAPAEYETTTGLRFTDLDIPRGVDITSAYIEFTADRGYSGDFSFSIEAQDSGNAQSYTSSANDITDRATNGASVTWATGDAVAAGQTYRTPDISELVEDIVDRTDWCGGNDMAFMITGVEGLRSAWSYNGDPSLAPKLVVRYDYGSMPEGASCYQDNISRRIVSSYDDVEEKTNGDVSRNSNTLNLESGNLVGLRFSDINIPKGAQIMNAYLELTQKTNQDTGQDISIQIAVEDNTGDAESFSGSDDSVSSRTYAGNTVSWTNIENWYKNNAYVSPDIKDLIATAVNNNNWVAGNALVLKLNTTGSRDRRPYSFNSSPGQAPRLMVEYAATGSGGASREVRDELLTVVDNLSHSGWTPIQDTLYEAALYYTGGAVKWGAKRGGGNGESGPHAYTRVSHEASMVPNSYTINYPSGCTEENLGDYDCRTQTITGSATYASPIDNYCQKTNHIVLLTDGYANRDHSKSDIKNLIGTSSCSDSGTYSGGQNGGECVQDLTKYLSENDLSDLKLEQEVITHTIGFQFSSEWLEKVATESGGLYKSVGNADDLVGAIDNILVDALKVDNTFVAPVAAVNQFNRLNNLDDIYFAVFRPDEYPNWPGNVKKYKLGAGNIVLDKNNEPAVDASTGFFDNDSKDLWNNSAEADGKNVEKGGASSQVAGYESRNVYTYHSNSTTTTLSNNTNRLDTEQVDSGKLTKAMFDATSMTDAEFDDLIDWVRGKDVPNTTNRNAFNDPLHSRPVAVTYNVSEDDPDVEIFVGTNGGGLHSINAKTGAETFIFFRRLRCLCKKI